MKTQKIYKLFIKNNSCMTLNVVRKFLKNIASWFEKLIYKKLIEYQNISFYRMNVCSSIKAWCINGYFFKIIFLYLFLNIFIKISKTTVSVKINLSLK